MVVIVLQLLSEEAHSVGNMLLSLRLTSWGVNDRFGLFSSDPFLRAALVWSNRARRGGFCGHAPISCRVNGASRGQIIVRVGQREGFRAISIDSLSHFLRRCSFRQCAGIGHWFLLFHCLHSAVESCSCHRLLRSHE